MSEDKNREAGDRLEDLSRRLDEALGQRETDAARRGEASSRGQALGAGFRLASELIAAALVGLALGLGFDAFVGTAPFGLLAGLFIGFAAGLRNAVSAFTGGGATNDKNGDNAGEGQT